MPELPEELRSRPPRGPGQEPTTTRRDEITEKIKVAREHGDLKENAEYHAAKDEQGMMESRIRKVQQMLRDPDIVEAPTEADAVGPGMLVTVKPLDFDEEDDETYLIAEHAEEKAPGARTVTTGSPFGSALVGTAIGDEVAYEAPRVRDMPAPRKSEGAAGGAAQRIFAWPYRGVLAFLLWTGVSPNQLTVLALVANVISGILILSGARACAAVALILGGIFDVMDGSVARQRGESRRSGAFMDSVLDRIATWSCSRACSGASPP